jgi:hypothetical protein
VESFTLEADFEADVIGNGIAKGFIGVDCFVGDFCGDFT